MDLFISSFISGNLHNLKYKIILVAAVSVVKIVSASSPRNSSSPTPLCPPRTLCLPVSTLSRLQAGDAGEVGVAEVVEEVAAEAGAGRAASRVPPPPARARCILRHKIMAQGLLISSPLQFKSSQNCRLLIQVAVKYFKLTSDLFSLLRFPRVS